MGLREATVALDNCNCFFLSCDDCSGKQITCPAFDDIAFKTWLPSKEGDKLIFHSSKTNEIYKMWIGEYQGVVGYEEYHSNLW